MDRYVADDIIDKVLLRDLPSLYGISDTQELNRLFTTLTYNTAQEVSIEQLSRSSTVAKNTIKKYIEYLEAAFLIRRIYRVDQNARRFKKQSYFKVYLTNPCLRAALFGAVKPADPAMGPMAETAIVSQHAHSSIIENLYYARWRKGEVDLVEIDARTQKVGVAIEVKWRDATPKDWHKRLRSFLAFCERTTPQRGQGICTRTQSLDENMNGVVVFFRPVSAMCYWIGDSYVERVLMGGRHPLSGLLFAET